MKPINCTALSRLLVLLILLMTACQAASPAKKARAHTHYDFQDQFRYDYPSIEVTSDTVKQDKNSIIFEGRAELKRGLLVNFFADYISIESSENRRINHIVELKGNVSMVTSAVLTIKSEQATSLDFGTYIDFVGNVSISNKGQHYKTDWVRYYFLQEKLQFRWNDDIPTRGHITR